jgi:hypothetical protein
MRDEMIGRCRKPHNGKLHNLFSSVNIIGMLKSRMMRWIEHTAGVERYEICTEF